MIYPTGCRETRNGDLTLKVLPESYAKLKKQRLNKSENCDDQRKVGRNAVNVRKLPISSDVIAWSVANSFIKVSVFIKPYSLIRPLLRHKM
jgi:hypothetical protein